MATVYLILRGLSNKLSLAMVLHGSEEEAEFAQVVPIEYRADLVLTLIRRRPVMGLVVEVQLGRDRRKRLSWPLYAAALHARLACPVALVVLVPSAAIWS